MSDGPSDAGRAARLADLPDEVRVILDEARRGVLATVDELGRTHAVPVCYAIRDGWIITPIDAKPKSGGRLGRRRNLERDPRATLMVDRWDEDWSRLGWVMIRGVARSEPMGDPGELIERYPQYGDTFIGDELIALEPQDITWWLWAGPTEA